MTDKINYTNVTHFVTQGKNIIPRPQPVGDPVIKLRVEIFTVGFDPDIGYFLTEKGKKFALPPKIFGNMQKRANKIINTYEDREHSTGIALTGFKGSGKSVMCKMICNKMLDKGIPVIIVNSPFSGEGYNAFIESLGPVCVFMDEFGKVYNNEEGYQDKLLTLLDGQGSTKNLYIATENDKNLINKFMWDRPGRMYYHFKYDSLDRETIRLFCVDHGLCETRTAQVLELSRTIDKLSFDMLGALVEEMVRYDMSASEAVEDLNIEVNDFSTLVLRPLTIERKSDGMKFNADQPEYDKKRCSGIQIMECSVTPEQIKWRRDNYDKYYHDNENTEEFERTYRELDSKFISLNFGPSHLVTSEDDKLLYDNGTFVFMFEVAEKTYDYSRFMV